MKIAHTIELHIGADLWPAITLARIKIFWSDKKHLVGLTLFFQKHHKTYFDGRPYRDPPAPLTLFWHDYNCRITTATTTCTSRRACLRHMIHSGPSRWARVTVHWLTSCNQKEFREPVFAGLISLDFFSRDQLPFNHCTCVPCSQDDRFKRPPIYQANSEHEHKEAGHCSNSMQC